MRQLIFGAFILGSVLTASAQQTIYSQDFEGNDDDIFADGWDFIDLHGDSPEGGIFSPSPSIQARGFTGKTMGGLTFDIVGTMPTHNPNTDIAIKSADYDIPEGITHVTYRVGSVAIGTNASSHYSVYIMRDDEFTGIATGEQLKAYLDTKTPDDSATISGQSSTITLDLSAFAEDTVALVFRLHDSPSNSLLLFDDVIVQTGILDNPDFTSSDFMVYPNPANSEVNITGIGSLGKGEITIADLNGRILATKKFNSEETIRVDISSLASGTYFMAVKTDKGLFSQKIIKQS